MTRIVLDVSMSLDGFAAGPDVRADEPMGEGGERLHEWHAGDDVDRGVREASDGTVGATIVGRRTFDLGVGPWGGTPFPGVPAFVVTHRTQDDLLGDNGGTFTFGGLEDAALRAVQAAGGKDVWVLGPAVARSLMRAGLLDEVHLHLVPVLLGAGTPLFTGDVRELVPSGPAVTGTVTHQRYRVRS